MAKSTRTAADLQMLRQEIAALIAIEIFSTAEVTGPLFRAAVTFLILNLHDLLKEVGGGDELILSADGSDSAAALISRARYAIVHGGAVYRTKRGQAAPWSIMTGEHSGYVDDIAVEIGGVRLLLRRHAVDAFDDACRRMDQAR